MVSLALLVVSQTGFSQGMPTGKLGVIGDSIASATNSSDLCGRRDIIECVDDLGGLHSRPWSYSAGVESWSLASLLGFPTDRVVDASDDGGCMAYLSEDPAGVLPACKNSWVTFSCTGTYTDPIRAYRMLDQAQLALATGKRVDVTIHDSKMHNGYCFASRINLRSQ